jgi:hypothetical protein
MPAALFFVFLLLGCRETLYPKVSPPRANPTMDWGKSLAKAVNQDGDVDYGYLRKHRKPLDAYVAWIGRDVRLRFKLPANAHAFFLNAHAALSIYQVLAKDISKSICEVPSLLPGRCLRPTLGTDFRVGRERLSLWEIYNERVISAHQDYRDLAAMNPGVRSGPPVYGGVYAADDLKSQLNGQMARWFRHKRRGVRVLKDHAVFNEIFARYGFELDLFTDGRDLCRIASVFTTGEKSRALKRLSARGCPHEFARFDRRLNAAR